MANEVQVKPKFSVFVNSKGVQQSILNTLQDATRSKKFTSSIISAVTMNPALLDCDQATIISGALLGESLNLSHSTQLGHYYLVPFNDKKKGKVANFLLGYKGYIQLAIRSGQYKNINVKDVRDCDKIKIDSASGEVVVTFNEDYDLRLNSKIKGYYAYIKLVSGFEKSIYWSKEEMLIHADKYSPAFSKNGVKSQDPKKSKVSYEDYINGNYNSNDEWKYSSFWYKSFDEMAFKTLLRQIISKWGIMSIEMQEAFTKDDTFGDNTEQRDYVDADYEEKSIQEVNEKQEEKVASKELKSDLPNENPKVETPKQPTNQEVNEEELLNF